MEQPQPLTGTTNLPSAAKRKGLQLRWSRRLYLAEFILNPFGARGRVAGQACDH
jgi:hypothetical protein